MPEFEPTASRYQRPALPLEQELGQSRQPEKLPCKRTRDDLTVCPACGGRLVHPLEWAPAGATAWRVALRCPDCEWHGGGVYSAKAVERLDDALEAATEVLLENLDRLARANLEERIARFAEALECDGILPEDF